MTAEQWNTQNPIGTTVEYRAFKEGPVTMRTTTRSEAWKLPSGYAVVLLRGKAGGVSLDHLTVIE